MVTTKTFSQNIQGKKIGVGGTITPILVGGIVTFDLGYHFATEAVISKGKVGFDKKAIRVSYSLYDYGDKKTFLTPYMYAVTSMKTVPNKKWVEESGNEFTKTEFELSGAKDVETSYGVGIGGGLTFYPKNFKPNFPAFSFFVEAEFTLRLNKTFYNVENLGFGEMGVMYNF